MTAAGAAFTSNPLSRLAEAVPSNVALGVSVAAKLLGAALASWYAYDQDTLFPSEHFPRTWAFVAIVVVLAVASLMPWRYRFSSFVSAVGAGVVLFGGANLAERGTGIAMLVCGAIAWLAVATWNYRRGDGVWSSVAGLFGGAALLFVSAIGIALLIEN